MTNCRQRQFQRNGNLLNAHLGSREIDLHCAIGPREQAMLENASDRLGLSSRAWHRILKVARTIADLVESPNITSQHLAESLAYRLMDRNGL